MPNKNSNKKIIVGGVETFSIADYPSKVSAVIFMQGCPWRCPFCYNHHLQKTDSDTDFVWEKFKEFLEKRKGVLDAVVFSGGEPLLQEALPDAMDEIKDMGYTIGIHTGGYRPDLLVKVLSKVSWIGFDIKAPLEENHYRRAIGFPLYVSPNEPKANVGVLPNILKSLDIIMKSGVDFECRTTCDPRILKIEDIYTIAKQLKAKGVKKYHLQKYRPIPNDTTTQDSDCDKFFQDKELEAFLKENFEEVELRQ